MVNHSLKSQCVESATCVVEEYLFLKPVCFSVATPGCGAPNLAGCCCCCPLEPCSAKPASTFPSAASSSYPLPTEAFWLCLPVFWDIHSFPSRRLFQKEGKYEDFFFGWHSPRCSWWQQTHTLLTHSWERLWQSLVGSQSPHATIAACVRYQYITAPNTLHHHLLAHLSSAWFNPPPCGIQGSECFCCRWIDGH